MIHVCIIANHDIITEKMNDNIEIKKFKSSEIDLIDFNYFDIYFVSENEYDILVPLIFTKINLFKKTKAIGRIKNTLTLDIIKNILNYVKKSSKQKIVLPIPNGEIQIDQMEVRYIENENRHAIFYLNNSNIHSKLKISECMSHSMKMFLYKSM